MVFQKGKKLSLEHKQNLSLAHKGKHYSINTEFKKGHCKGMTGKKHSNETKLKMSLARKGWKPSEETKIKRLATIKNRYGKLNAWNKGMKMSEEHKRKLSEVHIGIQALDKHPHWKGGKSFQGHDLAFTKLFRKSIRERDNYICMLCNTHTEKLRQALQIHHINYDKHLTISQNCISLCNSCHCKTNFNRKHWIQFFHNLLKEKYGYVYSNDDEVIINLNEIKHINNWS